MRRFAPVRRVKEENIASVLCVILERSEESRSFSELLSSCVIPSVILSGSCWSRRIGACPEYSRRAKRFSFRPLLHPERSRMTHISRRERACPELCRRVDAFRHVG